MCWMQNRNLKLTAKGRLWVRSTRVHHYTRTRQQPEAAGCLQEEHCLQAAFSLLAGINSLILFPSVLGLHFHKVFRLIHSRVTRTHVKSVLFWWDPDSAVGDCWSCADADPYGRRGGTEGSTGLFQAYFFISA